MIKYATKNSNTGLRNTVENIAFYLLALEVLAWQLFFFIKEVTGDAGTEVSTKMISSFLGMLLLLSLLLFMFLRMRIRDLESKLSSNEEGVREGTGSGLDT